MFLGLFGIVTGINSKFIFLGSSRLFIVFVQRNLYGVLHTNVQVGGRLQCAYLTTFPTSDPLLLTYARTIADII